MPQAAKNSPASGNLYNHKIASFHKNFEFFTKLTQQPFEIGSRIFPTAFCKTATKKRCPAGRKLMFSSQIIRVTICIFYSANKLFRGKVTLAHSKNIQSHALRHILGFGVAPNAWVAPLAGAAEKMCAAKNLWQRAGKIGFQAVIRYGSIIRS